MSVTEKIEVPVAYDLKRSLRLLCLGNNDPSFRLTEFGVDFSIVTPLTMSAIEQMRDSLAQLSEEQEGAQDLVVRSSAAAALSLTAGFVTWLLRTGSMMATVLSTTPLWRPFDPIPVLAARDDEAHVEDQDRG